MSRTKIACATIASMAILSLTSTAQANTRTSIVNGVEAQPERSSGRTVPSHIGEKFFNSSETATFFYKKGVSKLDEGKLELAASAFKAVLRADGSKGLDKITLHYLAYISEKQGNKVLAKQYAEAYLELNGK